MRHRLEGGYTVLWSVWRLGFDIHEHQPCHFVLPGSGRWQRIVGRLYWCVDKREEPPSDAEAVLSYAPHRMPRNCEPDL